MSTTIQIRLTPKAGRNALRGWRNGVLLVDVTAAPAGGAANEALIRLMSRAVGIPQRSVKLVRGAKSRDKLLALDGISELDARRKLPDVAAG